MSGTNWLELGLGNAWLVDKRLTDAMVELSRAFNLLRTLEEEIGMRDEFYERLKQLTSLYEFMAASTGLIESRREAGARSLEYYSEWKEASTEIEMRLRNVHKIAGEVLDAQEKKKNPQ